MKVQIKYNQTSNQSVKPSVAKSSFQKSVRGSAGQAVKQSSYRSDVMKQQVKKQIKEEQRQGADLEVKKETAKAVGFLDKTVKVIIYGLVFLLPIFFLPWTQDVLDFNKQYLLTFLGFLGVAVWFIKSLVAGRFRFNSSFLNIPVIFLLLVYGISTIFSVYRYESLWGLPFNVSPAFLTLAGFVILYFLIANILTKQKEIFYLVLCLVCSGFLAGVYGIFQVYGKFILPLNFTKISNFNTIGTVNSLAVFSAVLLPLGLTLFLISKKWLKVMSAVLSLGLLAVLFIINFWIAWIVLMAGIAVLFIFGVFNIRHIGGNFGIFLLMFLLVISLFFVSFKISLPGSPQLAPEISLRQKAEFNIAKQVLSKNLFLGTGPGTFVYNFSKFKSRELNQTIFWNTRFTKGASEFLDLLITTGIIGILGWLFLFGSFIWLGVKCFSSKFKVQSSKLNQPDKLIGLAMFSCFIAVVVSKFFYLTNISLILPFWVMLGGFAVLGSQQIKEIVFEQGSPKALLAVFISVLIFVFGMGFIFISAQKYIAEIKYLTGLRNSSRGKTAEAVKELERAIILNPQLDVYWRNLARLYLTRLNEIAEDKGLNLEEKTNKIQVFVKNAVNSSKTAADVNPENIANWNVRGFIYRNLIGVLSSAEDWAIKSYEKAKELEPANPFIPTEIGKVYIAKSDLMAKRKKEEEKDKALEMALKNFEEAIRLKPDYAPAHFQIALVYDRQGKLKEAISKMEGIKQLAPFDVGLAFQLGVLYWRNDNVNRAQLEFERAVALNSNYSNARYFLGLCYDKKGETKKALEQFRKIAEFNPDNEEVKKIINNLETGKRALAGIVSPEPPRVPIEEEKPEEIEE